MYDQQPHPSANCCCHRSFTYEEFISVQHKFQKRQAEIMSVKNEEVARSIDELIQLVATYPRENLDVQIDLKEVELFRSYYSQTMYKVRQPCVLASILPLQKTAHALAPCTVLYVVAAQQGMEMAC
jgi:hypothetical protein